MVKDFLPDCNVEMVTNGDPLNLKRLNKVFQSGLNRILMTQKMNHSIREYLKKNVKLKN